MPQTFQAIQAALVSKIATIPGFNVKTVRPFIGEPADLAASNTRTYNLPFCGVGLVSASPSEFTVQNDSYREDIEFTLLVIAKDARGGEYGIVTALTRMELIRAALIGHTLTGLSGVAPLRIGDMENVETPPDSGWTAYRMMIQTYQVQ